MVDLKGKSRAVKAHPDFKDQKYKVGHGKLKPQNEMRTDFKHKRIVLAKQTGVSDQATDPHLELFARCRHYSDKRRVEAFREVHACRLEIPAGLRANFMSIVCQGIVDEDKEVRKFAGNFFQEVCAGSVMSATASEALGLALRAALSHVQTEIRFDAVKLANAVCLTFLSEKCAVEISKLLLERRLSPEISALLLKMVRDVFLVRDTSSAQWRLDAVRKFVAGEKSQKIQLLTSLVQKIKVPAETKLALTALGVVFPCPGEEEGKKKRKVVEVVERRTFGVGGRAFAGLMGDDEETAD